MKIKLSLFFSLIILFFNTASFASIDQRNESEVIDSIYSRLQDQGYLEGIDTESRDVIFNIISTEVENSFLRIDAGELSLDTDAPNYFLFDTIEKIVKSVVKTVKTIGGKVFNVIKGVVGSVVDVGLKFLSKIDNDFLKSVVGVAADALGALISGSGAVLGAAALAVPVVGPALAVGIETLAPFATLAINSTTVDAAADLIAGASREILKVKDGDVEKGFSSANIAPNPNLAFLSLDKKSKSDSKEDKKQKEEFTKHFATGCQKIMKYLSGIGEKKYNALSDKVKTAAAHCNHFIGSVNSTVEK